MHSFRSPLFASILLCVLRVDAISMPSAFRRLSRVSGQRQSIPPALRSSTVADINGIDAISLNTSIHTENVRRKENYVKMTLAGSKTVQSEPVPMPTDMNTLKEFFAKREHRNLLFPQNEASDLVTPTAQQLRTWSREARLGGASPIRDHVPTQSQVISISANLNLPGVKVTSASKIGANLFLPDKKSQMEYPEYQFTLLESQLSPRGPKPLVWLFNQLTKYRDSTHSFTRVRAVNAGGVNCDKIAFVTEARLETNIRIPRLALKLLPVKNVEKFERQGSEAIQKLLEKELQPALSGFRDTYLKSLSE